MIEKLSPQERLVLAEMGRGGTNKAIARRIEKSTGVIISENHISVVLHNIGRKLDLHDRASIAIYAVSMEAIALSEGRKKDNEPFN